MPFYNIDRQKTKTNKILEEWEQFKQTKRQLNKWNKKIRKELFDKRILYLI